MSQTRMMSFMEAATSVAAGFLLSLGMQVVLFPAVGLQTTWTQNLKLALGFTVLSLARSYGVRRLFEYLGRTRTPGGRVYLWEKQVANPSPRHVHAWP